MRYKADTMARVGLTLDEVVRKYFRQEVKRLGREEAARRCGCGLKMIDHLKSGRRKIGFDDLQNVSSDKTLAKVLEELAVMVGALEITRSIHEGIEQESKKKTEH